MKIALYHVDAFTSDIFSGNPACVCVLHKSLSDLVMQSIAKENNLPVTAFITPEADKYLVRWFTPDYELELCGHGTLAAGYVIFNILNPKLQQIELQSLTETFIIKRDGDMVQLNFAAREFKSIETNAEINASLGVTPIEIYEQNAERCVLVLEHEEQVRNLDPDFQILKKLKYRGIVVTARGKKVDFVSRTFYPKKSHPEDAVTGASHTLLVPYWAKKLAKNKLQARQLSERGGELFCELKDGRVLLDGQATLYMQGTFTL
jgi:PhzF family phenazine biosynthesis protein